METDIRAYLSGLFFVLGLLIILVASIGVNRLPDFYTRTHAAGKVDTMGLFFILAGLIIYSGFNLVSLKLLIIMLMVFIINPTASYFLGKAAYLDGLEAWGVSKKGDDR